MLLHVYSTLTLFYLHACDLCCIFPSRRCAFVSLLQVYADVPISAFSEWLRSEDSQNSADGEMETPRYYLSEMDDVDELCPAMLPDLDYLRPFEEILPWGSFIPFGEALGDLFGFDLVDWSGLYAPLYPVLWWGPARTRTGLHYDLERYNILAQIVGEKNVTFFSPDQDEALYPNEVWDRSAVISSVSLWDRNRKEEEKTPLFDAA